mmetsp:Transcript_135975/g.434981  ORF Transcript_135975/g.434981 Transcript_135975/m.434981 type:complete len:277 (+) Transcript_135975:561-1391(+)
MPHTSGESLTAERMICLRCNSSTRSLPTRRLYQLRKWCRRTLDSSTSTCPTGRTCKRRRSRPSTCQQRTSCKNSTQGLRRSLPSTPCSRPRWCAPWCRSMCRPRRAGKRSRRPTKSPWGNPSSPDRKSVEQRSFLLSRLSMQMPHLSSRGLQSRPLCTPRCPSPLRRCLRGNSCTESGWSRPSTFRRCSWCKCRLCHTGRRCKPRTLAKCQQRTRSKPPRPSATTQTNLQMPRADDRSSARRPPAHPRLLLNARTPARNGLLCEVRWRVRRGKSGS